MQYDKTGEKVNKDTAKNEANYDMNGIGTGRILWHLVKRHKFGLVTTWAITITVLYLFPFAPDLFMSLFKGL